MSEYTSGDRLHKLVSQLYNETDEMLKKSRESLLPKLTGQDQTLSEDVSISSLINDINKLKSAELGYMPNEVGAITFKNTDLYTPNILPSTVLMLSNNRICFLEDGLLYLIDYDNTTLLMNNRKIFKVHMSDFFGSEKGYFRLIRGEDNFFFVVPREGHQVLLISGDGITGDGDIHYQLLVLPRPMVINQFWYSNHTITISSEENAYYRLNEFIYTKDYKPTHWDRYITSFHVSAICDGAPDYLASDMSEIWRFNDETKTFTYVTDIYNETDYMQHLRNYYESPKDYPSIISFHKNGGKWILVPKSDKIFISESWDSEVEEIDFFEEYLLTSEMNTATTVSDQLNPNGRFFIFGFDGSMNMVAYSYANSFSGIETVSFGRDILPVYTTISVHDSKAAMLNFYEEYEHFMRPIDDPFPYTSTAIRLADYEDLNYHFGSEFCPEFVPETIEYENGITVIFGKTQSSNSFNVAITSDNDHWNMINIDPSIAINIQDVAVGNGYFIGVGLNNTKIIVSSNGYHWFNINLPSERDLISICYNSFTKKFYALDYNTLDVLEINPSTHTVKIIEDFKKAINQITSIGVRIICARQNLYVNYQDQNHKYYSAHTNWALTSSEDNLFNSITPLTLIDDKSIVMIACNESNGTYASEWIADNGTQYNRFLKLESNPGEFLNANITSIDWDVELQTNAIESRYLGENPRIEHYMGSYWYNMNYYSNFIDHDDISGFTLISAKDFCISNNTLYVINRYQNKFQEVPYLMSGGHNYPLATDNDIAINAKQYFISAEELDSPLNEVSYKPVYDTEYIKHYPIFYSDKIEDMTIGPIAYGNGMFVKLSQSDKCYISKDGLTWKESLMPVSGIWKDIVFSSGNFIALLYTNTSTSSIYYSSDAINWVKATLPIETGWYELATDNIHTYLVSAISSTNILKTLDGSSWSTVVVSLKVNQIHYVPLESKFMLFATDQPNGITINPFDDSSTILTMNDTTGYSIYDKFVTYGNIHGIYLEYDSENDRDIIRYWNKDITNPLYMTYPLAFRANRISVFKVNENYNLALIWEGNSEVNGKFIFQLQIYEAKEELNDVSKSVTIQIDTSNNISLNSEHLFCVHDQKLYIGLDRVYIIDLRNTFPDVMEGSFYVSAGEVHNQILPFTPDHVFLMTADSDSQINRFISAEIHRDSDLKVNGSDYSSITFFDSFDDNINYRVDTINRITNNGFIFANHTNEDRYINFIAIKEDYRIIENVIEKK